MNTLDKVNYAFHLATLSEWNMVATVRTHYRMKPHTATKKFESLSRMKGVNAVFGCLQPDRDFNLSPMVHMHLLLDINNLEPKRTLIKGLSIRNEQLIGVQKIKGIFKASRYITRLIDNPVSHHDIFKNN